jgi:hypothetical protein
MYVCMYVYVCRYTYIHISTYPYPRSSCQCTIGFTSNIVEVNPPDNMRFSSLEEAQRSASDNHYTCSVTSIAP